MTSSAVKQVISGTVMEVMICALTGFLIYQFVISVQQAKRTNTPIPGIGIFCLTIGILIFIGLNVLMILLIKKMKQK